MPNAAWPSRGDIDLDGVTHSESGIPIRPEWSSAPDGRGPQPGEAPFTRGIRADGYRTRPWTFRQYAGHGGGEATNERLRYLVSQGQTGLSVALDLPTQMGLDSDDSRAQFEVGRLGVAVDTIADMERTFDGIAIDQISTSFTINGTAPVVLALYVLVADRRGVPRRELRGTVQNDILKEFVARGAYLYPPGPSMRLCTDVTEFCVRELPKFNPQSIASAHIKSAGATPVEADAFMLAHALEYARSLIRRGFDFDAFGPQMSFLTSAYRDVFESIARFRACRQLWAELAAERLGATDPRAMQFRFHSGGDIDSMTFEESMNNVARMALNCFAAAAGGCQSLQLPCYDEAYEIPTDKAILNALRVQQIVAYESGVRAVPDPFGGSYYIEALTAEVVSTMRTMIDEIDADGGAVSWIEEGRTQAVLAREARAWEERIDSGAEYRVAANFQRTAEVGERDQIQVHQFDPSAAERQVERLEKWRADRDGHDVERRLAQLRGAAADAEVNVMPTLIDALDGGATVGEVSKVFEDVFGSYQAPAGI